MQGTYDAEVLNKLYKHIMWARPPMNERNEQIYAERMSGKTLKKLAISMEFHEKGSGRLLLAKKSTWSFNI